MFLEYGRRSVIVLLLFIVVIAIAGAQGGGVSPTNFRSSTSADVVRGGYSSALSSGTYLPPPGSLYEKTIYLPFLGQQRFALSISHLSGSAGHLMIEGTMSVIVDIDYSICESSGSVLFILPEGIQQMLRKFRTKLVSAKYLPETDTIVVRVLPPLPRHINIEMQRIQ